MKPGAGRSDLAPRAALLVVGAALALRLPFVLTFPFGGGDWDIYGTVAENILGGCGVSLSDPAGPACEPHFGGNQGPGYPAFVALVWALSEHGLRTGVLAWMGNVETRYTVELAPAMEVTVVMGAAAVWAARRPSHG